MMALTTLRSYIGSKSELAGQLVTHVRTPLYRNAYALIVSDLMASALGVLYWLLAARLYSTEQVGLNAAAISTLMLLGGLAFVFLKGTMIRLLPSTGRATGQFVARAYAGSLLMAGLIGAVFLAVYAVWRPHPGPLDGSLLFQAGFFAAVFAWSIFGLQDNVLTGLRQTLWVPVENISFGIAKIGLLVAFAFWLPQRGIFLSWVLPVPLLILAVNLLIYRRLIPQHIAEHGGKQAGLGGRRLLKFVASDYLGMLFWMAATMALPLLVVARAGATANAYFYLAWTIAFPLHLVASNMAASLTVEVAQDEGQLQVYTRRALVHMARMLGPLVLAIVVAAPLILWAFGEQYVAEATTLLRLLALGALPFTITVVYLSLARVLYLVRRIVIVQATLCALVLGGSYLLLPHYGITGVGIAWLASQTIVASTLLLTQRNLLFTIGDAG